MRIRNKSLQGANNIEMLQTVRNFSNSSCCDVHNGHSMWEAIKKHWKKKCVYEKQLKRKKKPTESSNFSCAEFNYHRKVSGAKRVNL